MIRKLVFAASFCVFAPAAAHATSCTLSASGVQFGVFSGSQLTFVGTLTIDCTGTRGTIAPSNTLFAVSVFGGNNVVLRGLDIQGDGLSAGGIVGFHAPYLSTSGE